MALKQRAVGARRWPVKIQQRPDADVKDVSGFPLDTGWTTLADVEWMHKTATRSGVSGGDEKFSGTQISERVQETWTMGYRPDMDPDEVDVLKLRRIVQGTRVLDIVVAKLLGYKEEIELQTLGRAG